ncbi:MAG: hypothetical protein Q8K75_11175 [Chlamydiales bacterium]|nr:hypothetical protein [Chlamydiales bacterium]
MNVLDDIVRISGLVNYFSAPGSMKILPGVRDSLIESISNLQKELGGSVEAERQLKDLTTAVLNLPMSQVSESSLSSSSSSIQQSEEERSQSEEERSMELFKLFPQEIIEKIFRSSGLTGQKKMIFAARNKYDLLLEIFLKSFIREQDGLGLNKDCHAVKNLNSVGRNKIKLAYEEKDPIAAGKMMADIVNTIKLSFKEVEAYPKFRRYVLPHLECYNFQKCTNDDLLLYIDLFGKELNISELYFPKRSYGNIPAAIIFNNLRVLHMSDRFAQPFPAATTFSNLRELHMGYFDQPFPEAVTFSNLRVLHMDVHSDFNQPFPKDVTFSSLSELHMGHRFNQPFPKDATFSSLSELHMGYYFNQPFPAAVTFSNLRVLHMGSDFNQPFSEAVTFSNLRVLHMGFGFNQPFPEAVTFSNLRVLHMGDRFNQPFPKDVNFSNLRVLHKGAAFNQELPDSVNFSNLRVLHKGAAFNQELPANVAPSINMMRADASRWIRHESNSPLLADINLSSFGRVVEVAKRVGGAIWECCLFLGRSTA